MKKPSVFRQFVSKQRNLVLLISFVAVLVGTQTVSAEVFTIDPSVPPVVTLPPDDAERIDTLLNTKYMPLYGDRSPNGKFVITYIWNEGLAFLNVLNGNTTPIDHYLYNFSSVTEIRWRSNREVAYLAMDPEGELYEIRIKRRTGEVTAETISLPGFPMSLSNRAGKVLVARPKEVESSSVYRQNRVQQPPVEPVERPIGFGRAGPNRFSYQDRFSALRSTTQIELVVVERESGEEVVLSEFPLDTTFSHISWAPRDRQLAIIRWKFLDFSRSGTVTADSPDVQDALGNLAPEDNPFFTSNALDIYRFRRNRVKHREIRPDAADGEVFSISSWDPSGMVLVTQMWTAGTPTGRAYPTYANPNGSTYRFYWRDGQLLDTLDLPETRALFGQPMMISPVEMLLHTPDGMRFSVFKYNMITGSLERLPTPNGSIFVVQPSARRRDIVYNFSSFTQPNELFRYKLGDEAPLQITNYNELEKALGQVRVDPVHFSLSSGAQREGYLIQPPDGTFPPDNVPVVVWQEGGPTSSMTEMWGVYVEAPFNILPSFGFSVLFVPLPGRDGFGPEFLDQLVDDANFGQIDIDEQAEIVNQLVEMGYTSWDQTGVSGCSYGGYFASQSITRQQDIYAAANPQCSLLNLFHEWQYGYTGYVTHLMGRTPDDMLEYFIDSPSLQAVYVQTPTLIFSGTEDFLPAELSEAFHYGINAVGTPADYYEFLGEGHGIYYLTSEFAALQAQIKWSQDYLM